MGTPTFARTRPGRVFVRIMAGLMESRLRHRFFGADGILRGAGVAPGMTVLEIGPGTGFFTVPAARLLGEQGRLVSLDALEMSVAAVSQRVRDAGLGNVEVLCGDALDTRLADERFELVLMFGVLPAPMLPVRRLLVEMRRVLRPGGSLALWPATWVHQEIAASRCFRFTTKRNGVLNYARV